jgi:3-hydroxyacyl-[acyl-carrier-protein] dehydratase
MNREELKSILPHRDNMLLLDEAERDGNVARGKVTIRGDEWFLHGHFPGNPVVPGVILCEILAQSACVLLNGAYIDEVMEYEAPTNDVPTDEIPMFTGLDKVKFLRPVRPGDVLQTECQITRKYPPFYFAKGVGRVGNDVCVTAEFSFALVRAPKTDECGNNLK